MEIIALFKQLDEISTILSQAIEKAIMLKNEIDDLHEILEIVFPDSPD